MSAYSVAGNPEDVSVQGALRVGAPAVRCQCAADACHFLQQHEDLIGTHGPVWPQMLIGMKIEASGVHK